MSAEKLNNIEEILTHQEQQVHDLSEMIIAQGNEIKSLRKSLEKMQHKVETLEDLDSTQGDALSVTEQAARDKPPHY